MAAQWKWIVSSLRRTLGNDGYQVEVAGRGIVVHLPASVPHQSQHVRVGGQPVDQLADTS